ncbi:hypothetical protein AB0K52_17575 [Glycomyces sp. NPDC049804]|uniref:hypothetical protein n=1 Tax=Glycomyces sp. NPDC049804 TaxID=3154363 RepID=UPI0034368921
MFEDRLAAFANQHLEGRPVPADLRVMLLAQWEGRNDFRDLLDLQFFEPDQLNPLFDTSYLRPEELADPDMQAVNAGAAATAEYAELIAEGGKGWIGYWFHPGQPADQPAPLLELDTEFTFWSLAGRTLAEACAVEVPGRQTRGVHPDWRPGWQNSACPSTPTTTTRSSNPST